MDFIVNPKHRHYGGESKNFWVIDNGGFSDANLYSRIVESEVLITDLDESIAQSPARIIAQTHSLRKFPGTLEYWCWVAKYLFKYLGGDSNIESSAWKEYVSKFLRTPEERRSAGEYFTTDIVSKILYPGVRDFYCVLPESMKKSCVTRNIEEVALQFTRPLGINSVVAEAFYKSTIVELMIKAAPWRKRYLLIGDSSEDEEALDVLRSIKKKGFIDFVLSIWVCKSPDDANKEFDISIGRNYSGLVEIIKNRRSIESRL
ncbi:hypothetical protein HY483_03460 [Candidatus Woesearchaeota archaeon]|nr:hypothetical protein [Candidatus Woesearchaeota archaeon]